MTVEHPVIPRLMRSTTLHYFAEVAERGSFRAAAESLRIAASALNRQISNLETDLGVKLFERARGRSGLQLTDAGRILQRRLRSAVKELSIASDEITSLQGLERGHVTVGFNDVVANKILPEAIRRFHAEHPNITFSVKVDNTRGLVSRLREGSIDFAVGFSFPPETELSFMESVSLKMYLIAPPDHPLATRPSIKLDDLEGCNFILPDGSGLLRTIFDLALRGSNMKINPVIETNSFELIHALVASGAGVGIAIWREQRADGTERFAHIEIDDAFLSGNLLSCCRFPDRSLSPTAAAFSGFVCESLRAFGKREENARKAG